MTVKSAKIAIYGAGAMGTILGALLTKGGLENVHLITRNKAHVQMLNEQGATIVCEADDAQFNISVKALTPDEMQDRYDVVFLMTKQRYNADILNFLQPHLNENAIVCTTQNGLPEKNIAEILGNERTYGAATSYGATFLEAGRVALTSKIEAMSMEVGGYCNGNDHADFLVDILSNAGKATNNDGFVKKTENLAGARWSKLAINAAFSGLSVVTGLTFGEIAKRRKSRKIALGVIRECMDVTEKSGVTLEEMQGHDMRKLLGGTSFFKRKFAYLILPIAMKKHKKLVSGMLKDVENGRKCEIDYINGFVCKIGKEVGVDTPLCAKITELVHSIENGLHEISYENVDFFD